MADNRMLFWLSFAAEGIRKENFAHQEKFARKVAYADTPAGMPAVPGAAIRDHRELLE